MGYAVVLPGWTFNSNPPAHPGMDRFGTFANLFEPQADSIVDRAGAADVDSDHPVTERRWARAMSWALIAGVAAWFAAVCLTTPLIGDARYHLASIAEVWRHPFNPGHPVAADADSFSSGRFNLWVMSTGWMARVVGATPYVALQIVGCLQVLAYAGSVVCFFRQFVGPRRGPAVAAAFLLLSLFVRTRPEIWSSDICHTSLAAIAPIPSLLAWAVVLTSVAAADRFMRGATGPAALVFVAVAVPVLLLVHALSAIWLAVAVAALGVHHLRSRSTVTDSAFVPARRRRVVLLGLACAMTAPLSLMWPWTNPLGLAPLSGVDEFDALRPYFSRQPVLCFAFVYAAAVPVAIRCMVRRERGELMWMGAATAATLLACRAAGVSFGDRFAIFAAFIPQALVSIACVDAIDIIARWRPGAPAALSGGSVAPRNPLPAAAALLAWLIAGAALGLLRSPPVVVPRFARGEPSPSMQYYTRVAPLARFLTPDDIVALPISYWSWDVPAVTGARVIAGNFDFMLPDFQERKRDIRTILDAGSEDRDRRAAIARRRVTAVLLVNAAPSDVAAMTDWAGTPIYAAGRFTLFRIR